MTIIEFFKSMYRAFIAQFNSAPALNSTPNNNSATNGNWTPESNSRLPNETSPTEFLISHYKNVMRRWPPAIPHSWSRAGSSLVLWHVVFIFGQDIDGLRNKTPLDQLTGWTAQLVLFTHDLPSMMRNGLFLTWENVKERENHVKQTDTEGIGFQYNRCYTVASSTWSGNLVVCAGTIKPIANFRLHHLSPDKVLIAKVGNHESDRVYYYDVRVPEDNANYLYDDMPLDGLWPWPKKEGEENSERETEGAEQMTKGEVEGNVEELREGEEMTKQEAEGNEEEKRTEREGTGWEEEETDSFSTWGSEDSLIASWRD